MKEELALNENTTGKFVCASNRFDCVKLVKADSDEFGLIESDQTTESSEKLNSGLNPPSQIEQEIDFLSGVLKNSKIEKLIELIDLKVKTEKEEQPRIQNNSLLLSIIYQIESLQLAQFAESVVSVHCFPDKSKYLIKLDETDNLPKIEVNEVSYRLLLKYRDGSNFIISYDKNVNFQALPVK